MSQVRKIRRRQQAKQPSPKPKKLKHKTFFEKADFAGIEARILSQMPDFEARLASGRIYGEPNPNVMIVDSLSSDTRAAYDWMAHRRAMSETLGLGPRVLTVGSEHEDAMRRFERDVEEALNRLHTFPEIR